MAFVELVWDPFALGDRGPCIEVIIGNSQDYKEHSRSMGFEYPEPRKITALLDTGASVTVVSKTFARHCKLFQTGADREISGLGGPHLCGEHAGSVSFPGTDLRPFSTIRIVSADFVKEPRFACLIGTDILRNWAITFDGRSKRVTIRD